MGGSGVHQKIVVLNGAAEAEAIALIFDTHHTNAAFQRDGRVGITKAAHGNGDDAIHALAQCEKFA